MFLGVAKAMRASSDLAIRLLVAVVIAALILWLVSSGFVHKLIPGLEQAEFTQDKLLRSDLVQFCSDWIGALGLRAFYPSFDKPAKEAGWDFCKREGSGDNQCRCIKACTRLLVANDHCSDDPFSSKDYDAAKKSFYYTKRSQWIPDISKDIASAYCLLNEAENLRKSIPAAPCINPCEATYGGQCLSSCSSGWGKRDLPNLCPTGTVCCVKVS